MLHAVAAELEQALHQDDRCRHLLGLVAQEGKDIDSLSLRIRIFKCGMEVAQDQGAKHVKCYTSLLGQPLSKVQECASGRTW